MTGEPAGPAPNQVGGPVSSFGGSGGLWTIGLLADGHLLVLAGAAEQRGQVIGGELPVERPGGAVVAVHEGQQGMAEGAQAGEVAGGEGFFWMMEKTTSIWLSQEACTGVWIMIAFGYASRSRPAAAWPQWPSRCPRGRTPGVRACTPAGS